MPVKLPKLSRREFLKRAALAGAAFAVAPEIHAGLFGGKSRDKNTFFFLSDTHIAGDPAQTYLNVNMTDHLATVSRELAAWPSADRRTRLVFITRGISRSLIENTLSKFAAIDVARMHRPAA